MRFSLVALALTQIARLVSADQRFPHIFLNDDNNNLAIADLDVRNPECIWEVNNHTYEQIDLDGNEARLFNALPSNSTIEIDNQQDDFVDGEIDDADLCNNHGYVCGIPACKTPVKHTAVILDSLVIGSDPALAKVNVTYGSNLAGGTIQGTKHGSKVCWVIAAGSNNFPPSGISCHSIVVFNDEGKGNWGTLLYALKEADEYCTREESRGRTCGVNFSGSGPRYSIADKAFADFASKYITSARITTVAAGNNAGLCSNYSPAAAGNYIFSIGATALNGIEPASFTNWGCTDNFGKMLYIPGSILTPTFVNNLMSYFTGTSAASPLAHRIEAQFQATCPRCKIADIKQATYAVTQMVSPPSTSHVKTPMYVLPTNKVCPLDNRVLKFCTQFSVKLANNNKRTVLVINTDTGEATIRVGERAGVKKFKHKLIDSSGTVITSATSTKKLMNAKSFRVFRVSSDGDGMYLEILNANRFNGIFSAYKPNNISAINISSQYGRIKVKDKHPCPSSL